MNVKPITRTKFYDLFNVKEVDLSSVLTTEDIDKVSKIEHELMGIGLVKRLVEYIAYSFKHPRFFVDFVLPRLAINQKVQYYTEDYVMRASIACSFMPKKILEIGTHLGVGAASFAAACPQAKVYTINPQVISDANNPIEKKYVGWLFRKRGLNVTQIWADSTRYNYGKVGSVDVSYVDGNHSYDFVLTDLSNMARITKKCVLVDDYIVKKRRGKQVFGPWNEGVVKATDDFLSINRSAFSEAYWIENTKLAVLIK